MEFSLENSPENQGSRFSRFKQSKFFLPLIVILIAGVLTFGLLKTKPDVVEEENEFPPLVVEVYEARLDEELRSSTFQGEVRAKSDIELVAQVTGKVVSISDKFIEGGQFAENEAILKIDDADYRVALKLAQASVAEANVELDIELGTAETNKKEWRDLVGESLEKANPLRLNKPQVQRARARVDAARAQLAQAQLDLSRTTVNAPFAGRVMTKTADLGQFISRGSSIGRVFSTDSVEIRIPMSDIQISELGLSLGQLPKDQSLKAAVTTRFGVTNHAWDGYLKSVDASVDNETRLLYGTVVVESPFDMQTKGAIPLAPGLFVDVELDAAETVAGVSVPRTALRNGNQVYVFEGNKLKTRNVSTLFTSSEIAVLSIGEGSELLPGELVIVSPVPGAFNGMAVELKGDSAADSEKTKVAADAKVAAPAAAELLEGVEPSEAEPVEETDTVESESSDSSSSAEAAAI